MAGLVESFASKKDAMSADFAAVYRVCNDFNKLKRDLDRHSAAGHQAEVVSRICVEVNRALNRYRATSKRATNQLEAFSAVCSQVLSGICAQLRESKPDAVVSMASGASAAAFIDELIQHAREAPASEPLPVLSGGDGATASPPLSQLCRGGCFSRKLYLKPRFFEPVLQMVDKKRDLKVIRPRKVSADYFSLVNVLNTTFCAMVGVLSCATTVRHTTESSALGQATTTSSVSGGNNLLCKKCKIGLRCVTFRESSCVKDAEKTACNCCAGPHPWCFLCLLSYCSGEWMTLFSHTELRRLDTMKKKDKRRKRKSSEAVASPPLPSSDDDDGEQTTTTPEGEEEETQLPPHACVVQCPECALAICPSNMRLVLEPERLAAYEKLGGEPGQSTFNQRAFRLFNAMLKMLTAGTPAPAAAAAATTTTTVTITTTATTVADVAETAAYDMSMENIAAAMNDISLPSLDAMMASLDVAVPGTGGGEQTMAMMPSVAPVLTPTTSVEHIINTVTTVITPWFMNLSQRMTMMEQCLNSIESSMRAAAAVQMDAAQAIRGFELLEASAPPPQQPADAADKQPRKKQRLRLSTNSSGSEEDDEDDVAVDDFDFSNLVPVVLEDDKGVPIPMPPPPPAPVPQQQQQQQRVTKTKHCSVCGGAGHYRSSCINRNYGELLDNLRRQHTITATTLGQLVPAAVAAAVASSATKS